MTRSPFRALPPCWLAAGRCSPAARRRDMLAGDKIDYRSSQRPAPRGLEVPPDLTQLAARHRATSRSQRRRQRLDVPGADRGSRARRRPRPPRGRAAATLGDDCASSALGNERWLSTHAARRSSSGRRCAPSGRTTASTSSSDRAEAGVMETDWAENRAKLPQRHHPPHDRQGLRLRVLDRRARQVPHARRAHRRPAATSSSATAAWRRSTSASARSHTVWQPRPTDPQLEAEFLARLMVKLGAKDEEAKAAVATAPPPRRRARRRAPACSTDQPGADAAGRRRLRPRLAPRRPGARSQRLHGRGPRPRRRACTSCATSTRRSPAREEPGFFAKLFSFGKKDDGAGLAKYRVKVTGEGNASSTRRRPRLAGQAGDRRSRQAHRRPAARRPEVTLAGAQARRRVIRFCSLGSGSSGNATVVEATSGITTTRLLIDCRLLAARARRAAGARRPRRRATSTRSSSPTSTATTSAAR